MTGGQLVKHNSGDSGPLNDPHYTVPLYRKAEAARIIRVPASTLRNWAGGRSVSSRPGRHQLRASNPEELLARIHRALANMSQSERADLSQLSELRKLSVRAQLDLLARLPLDVLDRLPLDNLDKQRLLGFDMPTIETVPHESLITTAEPPTPHGPTIPFVGLAEAYVLASFRSAGVPMQRIRPAIRTLEAQIGLKQALASERLKTDGAEVLWDYGRLTDDPAEKDAVDDLVVVRNGQRVFRPIVASYLRRVTYENGWARIINVGAGKVDVTVDPWMNGGRPTLVRRGIAADDVLSRIRAGESSKGVAADYGLRVSEVTALLELAA